MMTFVTIAALLLVLATLAYAWRLHRELDVARERLDRFNRTLFRVEESVRSLSAQLEENNARLRVELVRRTGGMQFTSEMTVLEATLLHPQAQQMLAAYHLGGCSRCAVEPGETIAAICRRSGVAETALLADLNRLIDGDGWKSEEGQTPVRLPNVQLELE